MASKTARPVWPARPALALVQVLDSARSLTPCADEPDKWFADESDTRAVAEAKAGCSGCRVRQQCLRLALDNGEDFGVWGGTAASERRQLRRQAGAAAGTRELEVASA
jgi:WhiB family redox-sensing transcriptional regulator